MIEDFYNKTFKKLSLSQIDDGAGGFTDTYSEVLGSDFKASLRLASADNSKADSREKYFATHTLNCSTSVVLVRGERLRESGIDYEIKWAKDVQDHHQKVFLKEIE